MGASHGGPTVVSASMGVSSCTGIAVLGLRGRRHRRGTFPGDPDLAEYSITQLKKQTNPELKVFVTYYPGGE
jgi:hypothetical protein